jgi:hypothetical protein
MRDHLVELRLKMAPAFADADAHRRALKRALGSDFVDRCRALPDEEVRCAINAKDLKSTYACKPATGEGVAHHGS